MSKNGQHWSREFEEAVLGAVLYDEKALEEIPFLKPEHFYNTSNSLIYKQMMKLKNAGEKIDTITVHDSLKELGLLDETGGGYFLTGLFDKYFTSANVGVYAEKIFNYAQRRKLLELGYQLFNGDLGENV